MRHGHQVCGSGCPCPAEKICDEELAVCINSHDGCYFVDDERYPRATFCRDGEFCALGLDQSGECYTAELCLAEELNCIYYDRTRLIDGPPVDGVTCPSGTANFCGEACGHEPCEINPFVPTSRASCIGIDEEHAIGVCALHTNTSCRPSFDFNENCELAFGQRCACLIDLREGPPRFGWITLEADCLAYRALRGDRFDCFDNTWSSI
jgi:hypothetical protein